jgi:hypothetical protein
LGYERERIWRNASSVPFSEPERSSSSNYDESSMALQPLVSTHHVASPSPPPELSLVAFRGNIYLSHMFSNHVWRSSTVLWLDDAASGRLGRLSMDSTYALSQANFGRVHHQDDIESQGSVLYGQCLTTLAGKLAHIDQGGQALLIPILLFLMHAVSFFHTSWTIGQCTYIVLTYPRPPKRTRPVPSSI